LLLINPCTVPQPLYPHKPFYPTPIPLTPQVYLPHTTPLSHTSPSSSQLPHTNPSTPYQPFYPTPTLLCSSSTPSTISSLPCTLLHTPCYIYLPPLLPHVYRAPSILDIRIKYHALWITVLLCIMGKSSTSLTNCHAILSKNDQKSVSWFMDVPKVQKMTVQKMFLNDKRTYVYKFPGKLIYRSRYPKKSSSKSPGHSGVKFA